MGRRRRDREEENSRGGGAPGAGGGVRLHPPLPLAGGRLQDALHRGHHAARCPLPGARCQMPNARCQVPGRLPENIFCPLATILRGKDIRESVKINCGLFPTKHHKYMVLAKKQKQFVSVMDSQCPPRYVTQRYSFFNGQYGQPQRGRKWNPDNNPP